MGTERYDAVVAGGGGAGLVAALIAANRGLRVLVVEKSRTLGGTYGYSSGLVWVPANSQAAADGLADSVELADHHIAHLAGGKSVEPVRRAYLLRGPEAIDALQAVGVPFQWIPRYPDYYAEEEGGLLEGRYISSPVFEGGVELPAGWQDHADYSPYYTDIPVAWREIQEWGGYGRISDWDWKLIEERRKRGAVGWGGATAGYLLRACLQARVDVELESRVVTIEQDTSGAVRGVVIESAGPEPSRRSIASPSLIMATGGYDNSPAMQRQFDPHPLATPLSKASVNGDGLQAAMNIGASFANTGGQLMSPIYVLPQQHQDDVVGNVAGREPSFPGSIVVNAAGRRFTDDSFYRALVQSIGQFDPRTCTYPNDPAYLVFDEEWKQTYRLGYVQPGEVPDWLPTGADARVLGAALGISGDGLAGTIDRFNEAATEGDDPVFGRGRKAWARNNGDSRVSPNPCVRPLRGQLYAIELKLGTMGTLSGLAVDADARVLRSDGSPIEGLYACGQSMASTVEGYWYNSGTSNGRALIFGYIAAQHVADRG